MKKKVLAAIVSAFSLALILGLLMPGCDEGGGDGISTDVSSQGGGLSSIWPVHIADYPGVNGKAHVSGGYAYLAFGSSGLKIYDSSNLSGPEVGSYATACDALNVFVSGGFAYVAEGACGLEILNLNNPTVPTLAATYSGINATDIYVGATVASVSGSLSVLDISSPTSPSPKASSNTSCATTGVSAGYNIANETFIYVAMGDCGIDIFTLSNAFTLTFLKTFKTYKNQLQEEFPVVAHGVFVIGRYLYVADGLGVKIFKILANDPTIFDFAASFDTSLEGGCNTMSVHVVDNIAYVGSEDCGLSTYDVSGGGDPWLGVGYQCGGTLLGGASAREGAITEDENTNNSPPGTTIATLNDQIWKGELEPGDLDVWFFTGDTQTHSQLNLEFVSCWGFIFNMEMYAIEPPSFAFQVIPSQVSGLYRYRKTLTHQLVSGGQYYILVTYADSSPGSLQPYYLGIDFE